MPRRPYTVTAKVLAACRTNLQKANAVPKSHRYRPTPRRLAACRRNLEKAHATLRTALQSSLRAPGRAAGNRSPAYGTSFRHGLYCVLLGRSLELAGESREDFREHIELFDHAFAPRDHEEARLVRAIAETAWRRLRAFRGQARWERLPIQYRLAEAGEKPRAGDPAARDEALAWELVAILARDDALMGWLGRLDHRMKRLCRVLVEKRSGESAEFSARPRDTALFSLPLAALSNPFLAPSRIARALEPPPDQIKPVNEWGWRGAEEIRASRELPDDPLPGEARELDYGLVRRGREIEASGEHDGLAAYERLFERAFGVEATEPAGAAEGGAGAVPLGTTSPLRLKALARLAWERVEVYRREAEQEQENLKRLLAAAAATRCRVPSHGPAECDHPLPEGEGVTGFEVGATSRPAGSPVLQAPQAGDNPPEADSAADRTLRLIVKLLAVFGSDLEALDSANRLYERLRRGFYRLLVGRYGDPARFRPFRPRREPREKDSLPVWFALLPPPEPPPPSADTEQSSDEGTGDSEEGSV